MSHSPINEPIEPTSERLYSPIHILNDDVLLNIFYLFQLDIRDEEGDQIQSTHYWARQRWWYKLTHVCQLWRSIILASPSMLDLHLVCTYGTPVADMLTYSPPLPLTIYFWNKYRETTAEDEEGILLALQHRDRVRCVMLSLRASSWRKFTTVMDEPFPILERMRIVSPIDDSTRLALPRTFQAPLLRHFKLQTVALPIGSPLLMTTVGLVTLALEDIPLSAYFTPSHLLSQLSLITQLEKLVIRFHSPLPSRSVEPPRSSTSTVTHITLPNLRFLSFRGVSTYLEGLLCRISAPRMAHFEIAFFNQLTFTVPHLLQFILTSENFVLSAIELNFSSGRLLLKKDSAEKLSTFYMVVKCRYLDWQVSSATQIVSALEPVLTVVEKLTLNHVIFNGSSAWHNKVDRTQWRELLRPFSNVKVLRVQNELVEELARSLHSEDEEMPLDILSNLKELRFTGGSKNVDAFRPFIQERQTIGHPANLRRVGSSEFPCYRG
jgi:hypothetical protein